MGIGVLLFNYGLASALFRAIVIVRILCNVPRIKTMWDG